MAQKGYSGEVVLISPTGEIERLHLPGRCLSRYDEKDNYLGEGKTRVTSDGSWEGPEARQRKRRQEKRFHRLLSQGWHVASPEELEALKNKAGEEWKKKTDQVIGTTQTGDQSHGGDHASGEVPDSPNQAKRGRRGNRGGRKNCDHNRRRNRRQKPRQHGQGGSGANPVICLTPIRPDAKALAAAEASAELLKELVGRSANKVRHGVEVNILELLVALETGDNPIPPLERPAEKPRVRVLVTPDCSGSTQSWSGLGQGWALHLAKDPEVEVVYCLNFNGDFAEVEGEEVGRLLSSVDIVLYLGDGDGHELCQHYASQGATVLAMDCHCASYANPRLRQEAVGNGTLYWVDRVSAKEPWTWYKALELCLGR